MSVVTTHRLEVVIPRTEGTALFAALSFGGSHNTITATSTESALACKQALAEWLARVNEAVKEALES